jgi:hypothetical protein
MVLAAHAVDHSAYYNASYRIMRNPPKGVSRYSEYFFYILWKTMFDILGRKPELDDAGMFVERAWPKYSRLLNNDKSVLLATIQDVIDEPDDEFRGPTGVEQNLSISAALGGLMENPIYQLLELRPQLAKWHAKYHQ